MHPSTRLRRLLAIALFASLIAPMAAGTAPSEGKGKPEKTQKQDRKSGAKSGSKESMPLISPTLGVKEARRIAAAHHYTGYGPLPPGIRKNLARGKPLPPGIAKKAVPGPMLAQLPHYPGYEWQVLGSDLVLVAAATAVIAEVLFDVFQ